MKEKYKTVKRSTANYPHPSEYARFLRDYLVKKKVSNPDVGQSFLTQNTVNKWPYPHDPNGDDSKIYEEILRKFNNNNKFGIGKTFTTYEPGAMGAYSFEGDLEEPQSKNDYSYFSFPPMKGKNPYQPDPKTIAHEVVHANDHQIDHLTPKIWGDLRTLYEKDTSVFDQSIDKLRNKINPKVFGKAGAYAPGTVLDTINTEINQFNREVPSGDFNNNPPASRYTTLIKKGKNKDKYQNAAGEIYENKEYHWQDGLPEMQHLVDFKNTRLDNKGQEHTIPNYHFKGTFASEFPAFALTNLTNRWGTGEQTGTSKKPILPLNVNEQEFLYNMLGHAENAYPSDEYPTVNNYIRARRNSITDTDMWKQNHQQEIDESQLDLPIKRLREYPDLRLRKYPDPDPGPVKKAKHAEWTGVKNEGIWDIWIKNC